MLPRSTSLEEIDITSELARRPPRAPNFEAENRALVALASVMASDPDTILQRLADTALSLCQAGSSGISILENDCVPAIFRWHATAGKLGPYLFGTTPRDFSPCGVVLDRNAAQLMSNPVRFYPYIAELSTYVEEVLLVPFYRGDAVIGTVWVVAHSSERKFDAEDQRVLMSLAKFASAATEVLHTIEVGKRAKTEISRLREEERAANSRAVRILESVTDAFFALDREWRFTYLNPQAERLLQQSRDELLGWVIWDAFPQALGTKFEREYRLAVTEQKPVTFEEYYPAPLNAWFEVHAYPLEDGLSVYFHNITIRKRTEEELRGSKERVRLALDSAELGSWNIDPATSTLTSDERFRTIFGITMEQLDYEQAFAIIHPEDRTRIREAVAAATRIDDPAPYVAEYRVMHPDGMIRWVFAKGRANYFNLGTERTFVSFDGTVADITDRKRAEQDRERLLEQLKKHDQQKNDFLATLAHELRNPLAAISNAATLLTMGEAKEYRDFSTETIKRQTGHLSRLIDDLLDISRINLGKIELHRELCDATEILDSAVQTVRALIEERKHTLDLAIDRRHLWVNADTTRLEQAVANLLTNAAKYSESGGYIRLSAHYEGGQVVIRVKDAGIGISAEKLPDMFQLFSQVDHASSHSEGGLGIGLALVKQLVELHDGTITATSAGLGMGSEFTVRLPAAKPPEITTPVEKETGQVTERARILVVDDNADAVKGMAILLELAGHKVKTAHDGPHAIEVARAYRPQFVLLDLALPGMSGYDVATQLRRENQCKDALIVAISGYGQDEDRLRTKAAGFDHHLLKPVSYDELFTLLSQKRQHLT